MKQQESTNTLQNSATAAIAAASATPFRTAFKITLGIAAAQLVAFLLALTGLATVGVGLYLLVK